MLLNNFFMLHEMQQDTGSLLAVISIDPAHRIFEGHFPGQPVVPGVCMVQIVKELLEQASGQALLLSEAGQIKFLQLLVPENGSRIDVTIPYSREEGGVYSFSATFKKEGAAVFKMNGKFIQK